MCILKLRHVDLVTPDIQTCMSVANYSAQRGASSSILASHKHVAVLLFFVTLIILSISSWGPPVVQNYRLCKTFS